MVNQASLYFHIPFCTKKCPYCHFYVVPSKNNLKKILSESVALEWKRQLPLLKNKEILSIYFGGGTPTLFAPEGIEQILEMVRHSGLSISPKCEITIEANPEELDETLLSRLYQLGIYRISLGVQSLDDRSLALLERTHGAVQAKEAIYMAKEAGFQNISIDLMYDLPDQTEASWQYTLNQAISLPISHLSLYNLTIEPHTSFYKRKKTLIQPDPQTSLQLLNAAEATLEKGGFSRYEISAFAKKGQVSLHNTGYWTGRPFLGFGPSAFSFWEGKRFRNIANLQRYARALREGNSPIDFSEQLPLPASIKERFTIHLRLLEGINLEEFPLLPDETVIGLKKWIEKGCIEWKKNRVRLTKRGTLFYDSIAEDLI